jgi:hypothetical protein
MGRPRRNLAGRWLALGQGVVWLFLLIFGGLGLVFGPAAWIAALAGRRLPRLSALLLVLPASLLAVSWTPALLAPTSFTDLATSAAIVLLLVAPALVAATFIVQGSCPGTMTRNS